MCQTQQQHINSLSLLKIEAKPTKTITNEMNAKKTRDRICHPIARKNIKGTFLWVQWRIDGCGDTSTVIRWRWAQKYKITLKFFGNDRFRWRNNWYGGRGGSGRDRSSRSSSSDYVTLQTSLNFLEATHSPNLLAKLRGILILYRDTYTHTHSLDYK